MGRCRATSSGRRRRSRGSGPGSPAACSHRSARRSRGAGRPQLLGRRRFGRRPATAGDCGVYTNSLRARCRLTASRSSANRGARRLSRGGLCAWRPNSHGDGFRPRWAPLCDAGGRQDRVGGAWRSARPAPGTRLSDTARSRLAQPHAVRLGAGSRRAAASRRRDGDSQADDPGEPPLRTASTGHDRLRAGRSALSRERIDLRRVYRAGRAERRRALIPVRTAPISASSRPASEIPSDSRSSRGPAVSTSR